VVVLLTGCVYFNGLYNANRLAELARRAARAGRAEEARTLWARAAAKAESVAARYPASGYRDDAHLLHGVALVELDRCDAAVEPLQLAAQSEALATRARVLLGRCWVALDRADAAIAALDLVVNGPDERAAEEARRWRGEAHLRAGRYAAAEADLAGASGSPFALVLARIALGNLDAPGLLLENQAGTPYDEAAWAHLLDALGAMDPAGATDLASRLASKRELSAGERARVLLADGDRWLARGVTPRALDRYTAAADAAPDSLVGRLAAARGATVEARLTADLASVPRLLGRLRWAQAGGVASAEVGRFTPVLARVAALADGANEGGDGALATFLAAEALRDSLAARHLAASLFLRLVASYPQSPLAPKALLAAAALKPEVADSLVAVLRSTYPESPYTLALAGRGGAAFMALEDSLLAVLVGSADTSPGRLRPGGVEPERRRMR
jgi:predicted negative regulator of RcsB-dependent stress response